MPLVLAPFAYAAAILLGVPAYFVMQRRGISSLSTYLIVGALIGLAFAALFFGIQALLSWSSAREHSIALLRNSTASVVLAVLYGAIVSAVFWLIAVRRTTRRS